MTEDGNHNFGQTPLPCDICDNTDNVIWNCVDCKANLCVKCYNDHLEGKPVKLFKNHKIVPVEEALRSRCSEEQCSIHPAKVYILHCNTCRQLVCPDCITEEDHKGHDLCKIEDAMAKAFQEISQYTEVIENSLLPECNSLETKVKENIKNCEDWFTKQEHQVEKRRVELKAEVDLHCDGIIQTLNREKVQNMELLEEDKAKVETTTTELKMMLSTKHEVMKKKNSEIIKFTNNTLAIEEIDLPLVRSIQLLDYMSKQVDSLQVVKTFIESDEQQMPHPDTNIHDYKYNVLHPDKTNEESNQKPQDVTKGRRKVHQGQPIEQAPVIETQILSRHNVLKQSVSSIETDSTDTAWVSSLNSKELMQVNMKGDKLVQIENKYQISHFRIMTNGNFISANFAEKCIQVLSGTGKVITNISTKPYYPSGICLTKDGQHVAVCLYREDKTSILQVYTTDGQLVQTVDYTDTKSLEYYTQRVTTNQSGDFCVAHNGLCTVFVISNTGSLRFTYDGSTATQYTGTFYPQDIVCDRYNHLLVPDSCNNAIHMLDQEGQFERYLLTFTKNGILKPRGLSLDSEGKLWVGQNDGTLLVVKYLR